MPAELTPKQQFVELVRQAESVLVLTHEHPDGDAIGTSLALSLGLKKLGKQVTTAVAGRVPETLDFLPGYDMLEREFTAQKDLLITIDESQAAVGNVSLKRVSETKLMVIITPKDGVITPTHVRIDDGSFRTDLIIVVDCGDQERVGEIYSQNPSLFYEVPVVNIDHHPGNTNFGKVNIVDVTSSSTAEIMVGLLEALGKDIQGMIDSEIATCLLTGITTDTGSFQNSNTTPKALTVAAQLVAAGARQQEIIKRIFKTRSLAQLRLWGRALSYLKEEPHHHFAWSTLTKADFVAAQATPLDASGGLVDELMKTAAGMDFVLLMYERDGGVKGSFRSVLPHVDVSRLANVLGGAGHTQAAAFFMPDTTIAQSEQDIIAKVRSYLTGDTPEEPVVQHIPEPDEAPLPEPEPETMDDESPTAIVELDVRDDIPEAPRSPRAPRQNTRGTRPATDDLE